VEYCFTGKGAMRRRRRRVRDSELGKGKSEGQRLSLSILALYKEKKIRAYLFPVGKNVGKEGEKRSFRKSYPLTGYTRRRMKKRSEFRKKEENVSLHGRRGGEGRRVE